MHPDTYSTSPLRCYSQRDYLQSAPLWEESKCLTSFRISTEYFIQRIEYYSSFSSSNLLTGSLAALSSDYLLLCMSLFCSALHFQADFVWFLGWKSHRTMSDVYSSSQFWLYSFAVHPHHFLRPFKPGSQIFHPSLTIHWIYVSRVTFRGH